ncbi:unnamed protein product [Parascedosporium putredinis]|uniref:Uncharacterized protein n=1 Tax=Parascedosporium putredinis TaxID=1442378 RepID=A0A9P1MB98_9PEZI|nr:unnamed protein product [Parascedosporium putredinis]CAI7998276.1 unnamed protein product [Parascedosporium putredinis]
MSTTVISPLQAPTLLGPLLPALPTAALSAQPATAVLPLLSPILRQRVQIFSSTSTEPWLKLLCYDTAKAAKLQEVVQGGGLDPHPVSGEVEVDWELDSECRYRRLDQETLQAFLALPSLQLGFQLVYCVGDKDGGGDGWRVGELTAVDGFSPFASFDGEVSISAAEKKYNDTQVQKSSSLSRSPAPQSLQSSTTYGTSTAAEDAYFAQYDDVQPAMDNHDPDEERNIEALGPSLGLEHVSTSSTQESLETATELNESTGAWTLAEPDRSSPTYNDVHLALAHPETAERQVQSEFGVKQHVSRSIRSLFLLSRASGIDREEFESMVRTELDLLGMMEGED